MNRAYAFAPEPERGSGILPRLKLEGNYVRERMLSFLRLTPGATSREIQDALRLGWPPNPVLAKLKKKGLVRVEHGLIPGRKGVVARWWLT